MFSKHHYLSHSHNNAAQVYLLFINDLICGFCSILHFPHPIVKNLKKVHRLVILPDYQGLGIGIKLLEEIGKIYKENKNRFNIVTSAPSLIFALKNRLNWSCTHFGRNTPHKGALKTVGNISSGSEKRITVSFELK